MKTLHVFHGSDLTNGVDRTTLTLMSGLAELGVSPYAIVPEPGAVTDALERRGFPFEIQPVLCCTGPTWRAELRYLASSLSRADWLETYLARENFDIVHLNTGHLLDAALASARSGVPAVWHIHSPFEVDFTRYERFMDRAGYVWLLEELGCAVIAVSDDIQASLSRFLTKSVDMVYNGIDVSDLEQRAAENSLSVRAELGIPHDSRLVIGVGRISQQKDFSTFVRVAEAVAHKRTDVCFAIAGPAEDQALAGALNDQIRSAGLTERVRLLGPRADAPRWMAQSDIFLSTAVFEGHPLTTLEAMALRRPVVAMACVGLRECIDDRKDGLLVPLGDVAGAAEAVLRLLDDQHLAYAIGDAARNTVESRFSSRSFAEQFLQVMQRASEVGSPRPSAGALEMIRGLMWQIAKAYERIDELDSPRGLSLRARAFARKSLSLLRIG